MVSQGSDAPINRTASLALHSTAMTSKQPDRLIDLWRSPRARLAAGVIVAAFFFSYADVLRTMQWQWATNDGYSYGYLIPLISGWLVWARRDRLAEIPVVPSLVAGAAGVLTGLILLIAGRMSGVVALQQVSWYLTLISLILCFIGMPTLRALALPVAYLMFMLPIWDVVTERLHEPFQLMSAHIGAGLVRLWNVPARVEGVLLYLPSITLEVARTCSGVNFLIAVLAISVPIGHMFLPDLRRRVLLVVFSVSVAILANALRVALIAWLAHHNITNTLHGPAHTLQGMFVSVIGYVAIFVGLSLLNRFPSGPVDPSVTSVPSGHPAATRRANSLTVAGIAVILVVVPAMAFRGVAVAPGSVAPPGVPLPERIGDWQGTPGVLAPSMPLPSAPDGALWWQYSSSRQPPIQLYVGNYSAVSLPGGVSGYWTDGFDLRATTLSIHPATGSTFSAKYIVVLHEGVHVGYLYWYVTADRSSTDRFLTKAYGVLQRLSGTGVPPVLVVVAGTASSRGGDPLSATTRFAQTMWPALQSHLSSLAAGAH